MYTKEPGGLSGLQYTAFDLIISEKSGTTGDLAGRKVVNVASNPNIHLEDEILFKGNFYSLKHLVQHAIRGTIGLALGAGSLGLGWLLSKNIRIWTLDLLMVPIDFLKTIPFFGNKISSIWNRYFFDKYATEQRTHFIDLPKQMNPEQPPERTLFQPQPESQDEWMIPPKSGQKLISPFTPHKRSQDDSVINQKKTTPVLSTPSVHSSTEEVPEEVPEEVVDQDQPWVPLKKKNQQEAVLHPPIEQPDIDTETAASSRKSFPIPDVPMLSEERKTELRLFCRLILQHARRIKSQTSGAELVEQILLKKQSTLIEEFKTYSRQEKDYIIGFLKPSFTIDSELPQIIDTLSTETTITSDEYLSGVQDAEAEEDLVSDSNESTSSQPALFQGIGAEEGSEEGEDSVSSAHDDFASISDSVKKDLASLGEIIVSKFDKAKKSDVIAKELQKLSRLEKNYVLNYIKTKNSQIQEIAEEEEQDEDEEESLAIQNKKEDSSLPTVDLEKTNECSALAHLFIQQSQQDEEDENILINTEQINAVIQYDSKDYESFKKELQRLDPDQSYSSQIIAGLDRQRAASQEEPDDE